jgi:predicted metal-dependent phosphoesterase TrpH
MALLAIGRFPDPARAAAPALPTRPFRARDWDLAWQAFVGAGEVNDAYALTQSAVKARPNSPLWLARLAESARCSNHPRAALAALCRLALGLHETADLQPALELAIGFVPGCEVSCKFSPGTMHLLCYFVEPGDGPLQQQLVRLRRDRETRNERLVARLNELGIPITLEQVGRVAGTAGAGSTGGAIGRPHFARVLAEMGAVSSYQDAFDSLLAKGGPAYIPKAFVDAPTTIEAATGSGALAVLAHPFSLGLEPPELDRTVGELAAAGLTGVECWYGGYSKSERAWLLELAGRHGLVATGGSDFHGTFKADLFVGIGLGDLEVPDSALAALRARLA